MTTSIFAYCSGVLKSQSGADRRELSVRSLNRDARCEPRDDIGFEDLVPPPRPHREFGQVHLRARRVIGSGWEHSDHPVCLGIPRDRERGADYIGIRRKQVSPRCVAHDNVRGIACVLVGGHERSAEERRHV